MRDIHSDDFQAAFLADMRRRAAAGPVTLEIDVGAAVGLIGQLQLALRHPANTGPTAKEAERFVRKLIDVIADTPVIRRGLEAGFSPENDVERKRP